MKMTRNIAAAALGKAAATAYYADVEKKNPGKYKFVLDTGGADGS